MDVGALGDTVTLDFDVVIGSVRSVVEPEGEAALPPWLLIAGRGRLESRARSGPYWTKYPVELLLGLLISSAVAQLTAAAVVSMPADIMFFKM